ncbi:MAG: nickel-dependent lactate racemase [Spirochaetes bacterium]|nr:nickel-dependent lactate racemase [Spirochaetota bacterium]
MKVELPWGTGVISVNIPSTWKIVTPTNTSSTIADDRDEATIVSDALASPFGADPIRSNDLAGKKVVIVVEDNTRPSPVYKYFHLILEELVAAGATLSNVLVIPGLGIHTAMTEEDMAAKIGAANLAQVNWENHDAFNEDLNVSFGTTTRGTEIYLNKHLNEAGYIISLGTLEPHIFAGFGGGMKNILPGVASKDTIGTHHQLLTDPADQFNRVGMEPASNPFRLDLEEVQGMLPAPVFMVNTALDGETISAAFAGDPVTAHREGIHIISAAKCLHFSKQVDAIICNSAPMDINFKQGFKCVGNSLPVLKKNGAVMGFIKADKGLDDIPLPDKLGIPLWLLKIALRLLGPSLVFTLVKLVKSDATVEELFLYYYTMQVCRQYDLFLYVPTLSADEAEALLYFEHFTDPQKVIDRVIWKVGYFANIAVFPYGAATYTVVDE